MKAKLKQSDVLEVMKAQRGPISHLEIARRIGRRGVTRSRVSIVLSTLRKKKLVRCLRPGVPGPFGPPGIWELVEVSGEVEGKR